MDEILIDIKDRELPNVEESFLNNGEEISNTIDEIVKPVKKYQKKKFICEAEGCNKFYRSKENLTLHFKNIHLNLKTL